MPGGWKRSSTAREEHTNVSDVARLLVHGYATIYVAYHTNGGEKVFAYYADEKINKGQIQVIGLQAPLLTEAQYQALMALLAANPGVGLQEMLLNLHLASFQSRLNDFKLSPSSVSALQNAFGIAMNSFGLGEISSNMELWWQNYLQSADSMNGKNIFYSALHFYKQ